MDATLHSISDGVFVGNNSFVFVGVNDARNAADDEHGFVWKYKQGEWHSIEIAERLVSCTASENSAYRFVAIAASGREVVIGDSSFSQELVGDKQHMPQNNGALMKVCATTDGQVYAVGVGRQVYKKVSTSRWLRADQGCYASVDEEPAAVFADVVALADTSLCAVGWDGEIWLARDQKWTPIVSPTNVALLCATVASNGQVYAAGASGVVLCGRDDQWAVLENAETDDDIISVVEFNQMLYLATASGLFCLQDNCVEPVKTDWPVTSVVNMRTSDNRLLVIGDKTVRIFDGKNWATLF